MTDICRLSRGICDAYGHMLVASGRAEVVIEPELSLWDMAAPSLIVSEAGGLVTDLAGAPGISRQELVVSNGHVHAETISLVQACQG